MATLFDATPDATRSAAVLSDCGTYRYRLTRLWDPHARPACFVMLNPSTADAKRDDPTIRRCVGFARAWGCGGIVVVNLFALRATDPAALHAATDPIGPANEGYIRGAMVEGWPVVAAWGAHVPARGRANHTRVGADRAGIPLKCLGVTKEGFPRHPLYVRADAPLIPYPFA